MPLHIRVCWLHHVSHKTFGSQWQIHMAPPQMFYHTPAHHCSRPTTQQAPPYWHLCSSSFSWNPSIKAPVWYTHDQQQDIKSFSSATWSWEFQRLHGIYLSIFKGLSWRHCGFPFILEPLNGEKDHFNESSGELSQTRLPKEWPKRHIKPGPLRSTMWGPCVFRLSTMTARSLKI